MPIAGGWMKVMENDGFKAMVEIESLLQPSGWRWNERKGGEGVSRRSTYFFFEIFPVMGWAGKEVRCHIWTIGPQCSMIMNLSHNRFPSLHRSFQALHYLSFRFSLSWLSTCVVASLDERNQLDESGQLTGHIFSFNPNHLIRLCILFNYKDATEERVSHLPGSRIYVLWGILVPFAAACLYFTCCMLSTFWCVAIFLM